MSDAFLLERDVICASGPETLPFLQGQLSQDVAGLADGDAAWSWLLAPNGKVVALLRAVRVAADRWLLDTDAGTGEAVLARLERFKLRTRVELEAVPATVVRFLRPVTGPPGALAVVADPWPGVGGTDVILPGREAVPGGVAPAGAYEPYRIAAGIPRMGAELDEKTIPAESGLIDLTVSFTKGCYTGQELVARVDSRGSNVPRRLTRFRSEGPLSAGDELRDPEGAPAGAITSAAAAPAGAVTGAAGWVTGAAGGAGGWVALGYVKRGVPRDAPLLAGAVPVLQMELRG